MSTLCHKDTHSSCDYNGSFIQTNDGKDGTYLKLCERKGMGMREGEVIGGYGDERLAIYILH
jgi:hypothetical protein